MSYCIYTKPKLFLGVLLAMNSTGKLLVFGRREAKLMNNVVFHEAILIITEYVLISHLGNYSMGQPPLRTGRALAGVATALAITAAFQLLVLRNPARRTLRLALVE